MLRVGALAKEEVGKYINDHFVSCFQKVGTFRIAAGQKQGGNVASYFCTPDNRVLHVIAGPVDAATLLREARWVEEAYKLGLLEGKSDTARFKEFFRQAHAERLRKDYGLDISTPNAWGHRRGLGNQGRVHLLMAAAPTAKVEQVYKLVFEKILNEKVSTSPVVVAGNRE